MHQPSCLTLAAALGLAACAPDGGPGRDPAPPAAPQVQALLNATLPEEPAIDRDVYLVDITGGTATFTRPAIPPLRTSVDGRVAVDLKKHFVGGAPVVAFNLFVPEKLTDHWASVGDGISTLAGAYTTVPFADIHGHPFAAADSTPTDHRTLCDAWPIASPPTNPYPCASDDNLDCYDLTVVSSFENPLPGADHGKQRLEGTPIRVKVADPKLATAHIDVIEVDPDGLGIQYGAWVDVGFMLEPMVTRDGRLLVMRLGDSVVDWLDPETGTLHPNMKYDAVYSVYDPAQVPCDVTRWSAFHPVSHAHHDTIDAMADRYGFARYPLRDGEGVGIADGDDLGGSYPWIDRDGDNLFFTLISSTEFYDDGSGTVQRRFADQCIDGSDPTVAGSLCADPATVADIPTVESDKQFQGVAFAGLWTHGKVVLLDGILNNTDFGLGRTADAQRLLALYRDAGGATQWTRVGTGRANGGQAKPAGAVENTTLLDSWEQLFNHTPVATPATVRDVVWIVNTGKASAEVAFDDYLDAEAFIVSEMTGSWSHARPVGWPGTNQGTYHDGFSQTGPHRGTGYDAEVRVQNAATTSAALGATGGPLATHPDSIAEAWQVPAYGVVEGGARIEPAALGGITGRGLWLDGADDLIRYDLVPQPSQPTGWYLGVFVDPRFDDNAARALAVMPGGGGRIELVGLGTVRITPPVGAAVDVPLGTMALTKGAWSHLGFAVRNGGTQVTVLVDGYPRQVVTSGSVLLDLFGLTQAGELLIGNDRNGHAFLGWLDEVKVMAYLPVAEVLCNQAHGTLIGLDETMAAALTRDADQTAIHDGLVVQASAAPAGVHAALAGLVGAPAGTRFACLHDYTVDADQFPLMDRVPPADVAIRDLVVFPDGPLVYNQSRPDELANPFCLSCHKSGNAPSLGLVPLAEIPGLAMQDDPRRQPMQPPRWLFGNLPANHFGLGLPSMDLKAGPTGINTDPYLYPP